MKVVEQLERLKYIHELIEKRKTGTPDGFAKKLRISRRQLYYIIDELKLMGAPIDYDIQLKTFFYSEKCEINIRFDIDTLSEEEIYNV